eukprot:CAMPEP_0181314644 /NCGR_PEP_ID=MMETSP1101-20121128/14932_1 /TAXON_ID=46948 /ORGANISM="Rhodomonas abbreviata, Strain Caron Lab Isolate" /LENGTH=212 /DNA_ID=CAMNT_0023421759 /DNA_START=12 /DNA_END=650 /DNA_ORIENTATION=+
MSASVRSGSWMPLVLGSVVLVVAALAVVGSGYIDASAAGFERGGTVELESALLPPQAFRRWIASATDDKFAPEHDLKLDRFAGRGRGPSHPTEMPGYFHKELKTAKKDYNDVLHDLREVEEDLEKDPQNEQLQDDKEELEAKLVEAKKGWDEVQMKIDKMNKELVHGRAATWDKDGKLGVSDNFVPAKEAAKQQEGRGYGHKYSIVDWLTGE